MVVPTARSRWGSLFVFRDGESPETLFARDGTQAWGHPT
jgi:hypothetical protein